MSERENCLDTAKRIVCNDREDQYGSPEDNFLKIAHLWTEYLRDSKLIPNESSIYIKPRDVAIMMTLMKIARIEGNNFKGDSYIDACGYLACGYEIEMRIERAKRSMVSPLPLTECKNDEGDADYE